MKEQQCEIGFHPLTEAQFADEGVEQILDVKEFADGVECFAVTVVGNVPDDALPFEALDDGLIPPELRAIAKHDAEAAHERDAVILRREPEHGDRAVRRVEHAGEDLHCRAFSGTVGPRVGDEFALFYLKRHVVQGCDDPLLGLDEVSKEGAAVGGPLPLLVVFRNVPDVNGDIPPDVNGDIPV